MERFVNRFDLAADVLAQIQACLGPGCDYSLFASRAIPPAECNSIAVTYTDAMPEYESDCPALQGCGYTQSHVLRIIITRCCVRADAGQSFSEVAEQDAAQCLWRDVDLLEHCLACADLRQWGIDHGITTFERTATRFDVETLGGCSSAYLDFRVVAEECCP